MSKLLESLDPVTSRKVNRTVRAPLAKNGKGPLCERQCDPRSWLAHLETTGRESRVRVVTGSLSLLAALGVGHIDVRDAPRHDCWRRLPLQHTRVHFAFAFGHCGLEGNEVADAAAKQAATLPASEGPAWWKDAARAKWRPVVRADDGGRC